MPHKKNPVVSTVHSRYIRGRIHNYNITSNEVRDMIDVLLVLQRSPICYFRSHKSNQEYYYYYFYFAFQPRRPRPQLRRRIPATTAGPTTHVRRRTERSYATYFGLRPAVFTTSIAGPSTPCAGCEATRTGLLGTTSPCAAIRRTRTRTRTRTVAR